MWIVCVRVYVYVGCVCESECACVGDKERYSVKDYIFLHCVCTSKYILWISVKLTSVHIGV